MRVKVLGSKTMDNRNKRYIVEPFVCAVKSFSGLDGVSAKEEERFLVKKLYDLQEVIDT